MSSENASRGLAGLRLLSLESRRADQMAKLIENHGGIAVVAPSMREIPLKENSAALSFAEKLFSGKFDVVIFLTGVGTRILFAAVETKHPRETLVGTLSRVAVVARGPKPAAALREYAISADGQRVVFVTSDDTGRSPVWLAPLNGGAAPRQVTANNGRKAYFGADGYVVFIGEEKGTRFVYRVKEDGSELQKVVRIDSASFLLFSISPDGQWLVVPGSTDIVNWPDSMI